MCAITTGVLELCPWAIINVYFCIMFMICVLNNILCISFQICALLVKPNFHVYEYWNSVARRISGPSCHACLTVASCATSRYNCMGHSSCLWFQPVIPVELLDTRWRKINGKLRQTPLMTKNIVEDLDRLRHRLISYYWYFWKSLSQGEGDFSTPPPAQAKANSGVLSVQNDQLAK
jgi:hypothetical protein